MTSAHTHTHDRRTPSSSSTGETALLRVHLLRSRPAARLDPHSPTGPAEAWGETAQTVGVQWRTGQRERGGQKDLMLRPESWQLYNDTLQIIPLIRAFGEEKGRGEKRNPLMLNQLEKEKSADTWDKLFTNRLKRKTENNRLHHIKSETSASFPQTNEAKWDSCFMTVQDVLKSLSLIWMICSAIHPFQLYGPTGALWTGLQDCTWSSLIISSLASQQPSNIH